MSSSDYNPDHQRHMRRLAMGQNETGMMRLKRKLKEEPFIPIGLGVTAGVLGRGFYAFVKGKPLLSQRMMRWRVLAQGGTLMALAWGLYMKVKWSAHTDAATTAAGARIPTIDKTFFLDNAIEVNVERNAQLLPRAEFQKH